MKEEQTQQTLRTLLNLPGIGHVRARKIFGILGSDPSPGDLLEAVRLHCPSNPPDRSMLEEAVRIAEEDLLYAHRFGIRILSFLHPEYPARLREGTRPPVLLYAKGGTEGLGRLSVASVIGSRFPTAEGLALARTYGRQLARGGFGVVSGLALGIDGAAHRGCLEAEGRTMAVLPHGLGLPVYPPEHAVLARGILSSGGLLLSEQSCLEPPQPAFFVERDRIQSGMAAAVLLVESEEKGGAMHAARDALKLGRPLGVCRYGDFLGSPSFGGNRKALGEGAIPIEGAEDLRRLLDESDGC